MSGMLACQYVTSLLGVLEGEVARIEGQGIGKVVGSDTSGMGSAMVLPSVIADIPRSLGTGVSESKKGSFSKLLKGLGLATALSASVGSGVHFADDIGKMFAKSEPVSTVSSWDKLSRTDKAKQTIMDRLKQQGVTDQSIIDQHMKNAEIITHQFEDKAPGGYVNLFHKGSVLDKGMQANGAEKGYNVFGGHGNYLDGVTVGPNDKEALELGIKPGEKLSAKGIARMIKESPGFNPDYPVKLYNCEVGEGVLAQEISDILGVPVIGSTKNSIGNNIIGQFTSTGSSTKYSIDYSQVGEYKTFTPTPIGERGANINLYPDNGFIRQASTLQSGQRSSKLKNILTAPTDAFKNKTAENISEILKADKYYNNNLPLDLMTNIDKHKAEELANLLNQPVRTYEGKMTYVDSLGFAGMGENNTTGLDKLGKIYYPSNYKPKTDIILNNTSNTPWLDYAKTQLGVKESSVVKNNIVGEASNKGPEINEYLKSSNMNPGLAWCASFVNWSIEKAGLQGAGKYSAATSSWKSYGNRLEKPAYGAIATTKKGKGSHTNFVVGIDSEDPSQILLLGGNQGDSVNYIKRPIADYDFNYPLGYTPDYNIPKYDLVKAGKYKDSTSFDYLDDSMIVR